MTWFWWADKFGAIHLVQANSWQEVAQKWPASVSIEGPFNSSHAAQVWHSDNPGWPDEVVTTPPNPGPVGSGGGGSGGGGKQPVPGKLATFGAWKNWINSRAPGQGEAWISWVQAHAKIVPPESGTVDLNSNLFPVGSGGLLGGSNNHASNWFAAWILEGNVGPDIAKLLAGAIGGAGSKIPGILQDTGEGIGQVPGAKALGGLDAIGNFFSTLGDRATWVRIIKVVVGSIMIIAGLVRLGAPGAEQIAGKLPPVIPV
jgi:hypothetical protein